MKSFKKMSFMWSCKEAGKHENMNVNINLV